MQGKKLCKLSGMDKQINVGVERRKELPPAPGIGQGCEEAKGMSIRVLGCGQKRPALASTSG